MLPPRPVPLLPGQGKHVSGLQAFFSVFSVRPHGICCEVLCVGGVRQGQWGCRPLMGQVFRALPGQLQPVGKVDTLLKPKQLQARQNWLSSPCSALGPYDLGEAEG